jgi:hypothetical protein
LTFVVGSNDADRTFVISAIGNSAPQLLFGERACGLDVHIPDLFVPAPGVIYFQEPKNLALVRRLIPELWSEIENSPAKFILLNGVWNVAPELQDEIVACAKNRHVIVADQFDTGVPAKHHGPRLIRNTITISSDSIQRIHILIQASGAYC